MKKITLLLFVAAALAACTKEEIIPPGPETKTVMYEVLADTADIWYTIASGDSVLIFDHVGDWNYSFEAISGSHIFLIAGYNYFGIVTNVYVDGQLWATDTGTISYQGDIDTTLVF